MNSRIIGTGSYLPEKVLTNTDLEKIVDTSDEWIRSRTGQAKKVLVVGAEVYSRILDWNDRGTCVLFGDGAGAIVLAASDTPGILATRLHADGSYKDQLSVPGSVCGGRIWGRPFVQMDGASVFRFAVRVFEEVAHEVLEQAGMKVSDLDWF